jgi:hypothetical protein
MGYGLSANSAKDWFARTTGQLGNLWGSTTDAAASGYNAVSAGGSSAYNAGAPVINSAASTGAGYASNSANAVSGAATSAYNSIAALPDTVGGAVFNTYQTATPLARKTGDIVNRKTAKDQAYVGRLGNNASDIGNEVTSFGNKWWNRFTGKEVTSVSGRTATYNGARIPNTPPPTNVDRNIGDDLAKTTQPPEVVNFEVLYGAAGSELTQSISYDANPAKGLEEAIPGQKAYFSLFNDWSLIKYKGGLGSKLSASDPSGANDSYNSPTTLSGYEGEDGKHLRNPTVQTIIENTSKLGSISYNYRYFDFALAKYHGRIPNNYLVTVRRFPMPVEDNIISSKSMENQKIVENGLPAIAQAVTWFGESTGNELNSMLKFTVSQKWENVESSIQTIDGGGSGGKVQSQIGGSDFMSAVWGAANGMDAAGVKAARDGHDPLTDTYPNHVFGPINVIKEVAVRQQGLSFSNDITLIFEYDLRQIKGVNPKIAFLDLMANLLALTYNNGNFWGGSVRYTGGGKINKPIGDQSKLKSGDYGGYFKSIVESALSGLGNIFQDISENGLMGSSVAKNFIGGKLQNMFGTPQGGQAVKAFLSGDATGDMHVVIGNPLNPIAVIGNMYCDSAEFIFDGEMSYDGFPTQLKLTMNLKHARPRDKADIESMFNGGKGRIYLQPKNGANIDRPMIATAYGNKDSKPDLSLIEKMTHG